MSHDSEDRMAGALMDAIRDIRADGRVHRLPSGPARQQVVAEILAEVATAWQVDAEHLRQHLVRALEHRRKQREVSVQPHP